MDLQGLIYPIASLVGISVLTEATVETIKTVVPFTFTDNGKKIMAVVVSIILALIFKVSLISLTGPSYFVGILLAGLISSRGSTYIHTLGDIIESLPNKK